MPKIGQLIELVLFARCQLADNGQLNQLSKPVFLVSRHFFVSVSPVWRCNEVILYKVEISAEVGDQNHVFTGIL